VAAQANSCAQRTPSRLSRVGVTRHRSPLRRLVALASLAALSLLQAEVNGEVFKCVDAAGKTSYQADPCQTAADASLKVQAPAPLPATPVVSQPESPAATAPAVIAPAKSSKAAIGLSRASKDRIPTEAEFRGPRETWERLGQAVRRGDKDAALKELTPSAKQRLAPVFDTIGSKSATLNGDALGSIRSVMLAGDGLATITLTRTKADGTYLHQVHLIRDADGKWRIDNM
jgi:hypothetical protein